MTNARKLLSVSAISLSLLCSTTYAQDRHDDGNRNDHRQDNRQDNRQDDHRDNRQDGQRGQGGYVRHDDWKRGHRMANSDWSRGQRVDYRQYRLSAPRRGYEWRQVDGNFVMAAVATGLIASVVIANSGR